MEDIRKVKTIINRLNRVCDNENKSISEVLNDWQIETITFLSMIGLDNNLINDFIKDIIDNLLKLTDTRISFNPSIKNLKADEIEVYSSSINTGLYFLDGKVKVSSTKMSETEEKVYEDSNFYGIRLNEQGIEKIHFEISKSINKVDLKNRVITQKYPLKHVWIGINYESLGIESSFEVTINDEMLASDLRYIEKMLYSFRFEAVKEILLKYPAAIKIIGDSCNLHNFNTR